MKKRFGLEKDLNVAVSCAQSIRSEIGLATSRIGFLWPSCMCSSRLLRRFSSCGWDFDLDWGCDWDWGWDWGWDFDWDWDCGCDWD